MVRSIPHMKISSRQFWLLALVQVCVVASAFAWRFYVGTKAYLAHPTDGDLYAHHWSFQAIAVGVFAVPVFLVVAVVLIGLERLVWRFTSGRQQKDETLSA